MDELLVDDIRRLLFTDYLGGAHAVVFSMTSKANRAMYLHIAADTPHHWGAIEYYADQRVPLHVRPNSAIRYMMDGYGVHLAIEDLVPLLFETENARLIYGSENAYGFVEKHLRRLEVLPEAKHCRTMSTPRIFELWYSRQTQTLDFWHKEWPYLSDGIGAMCLYSNAPLLEYFITVKLKGQLVEWLTRGDVDEAAVFRTKRNVYAIAARSSECFRVIQAHLSVTPFKKREVYQHIWDNCVEIDNRLFPFFVGRLELRQPTQFHVSMQRAIEDNNVSRVRAMLSYCPTALSPRLVAHCLRRRMYSLLKHVAPDARAWPTDADMTAVFGYIFCAAKVTPTEARDLLRLGVRFMVGTWYHAMLVATLMRDQQKPAHPDDWFSNATQDQAEACIQYIYDTPGIYDFSALGPLFVRAARQ